MEEELGRWYSPCKRWAGFRSLFILPLLFHCISPNTRLSFLFLFATASVKRNKGHHFFWVPLLLSFSSSTKTTMSISLHHTSLLGLSSPLKSAFAPTRRDSRRLGGANSVRCCATTAGTAAETDTRRVTVKNGNDSLEICRVLNGMWQTSGGWGRIDRDDAVDAMLAYSDAGLSTFDMADHYGPAEDLYGIFINRVRRERPPEYLEKSHKMGATSGEDDQCNIQLSICALNRRWRSFASSQEYGTVMGGLLSEKFLDTNLSIPFAAPPLNTPSLQKYKRMVDAWGGWSLFQVLLKTLKTIASKHGVSIPTVAVKYVLDQPGVAGSMIGVRLGLAEHINDANAVFSLALDEEDVNSIQEVSKKGKDLLQVIGDCGDEYRRA
ncbi:hypothetical protein Tsubulata_009016 [Turnera subulata]|uniref:NADP-dependent oxidoreductase domain-containing protein n=1 Tax=Turnera subulata TaxID=218843 RepID=A0A9Q0FKU2_9ROSI|nr:hypothetical protein Tsubulata_009016 [Turnera subulata]